MTTTRTHFTFRIDLWIADGESLVEHVAGVGDYQVALAILPRGVWTLARHAHHLAARRASIRGQSTPARGVQSVRAPLAFRNVSCVLPCRRFREEPDRAEDSA